MSEKNVFMHTFVADYKPQNVWGVIHPTWFFAMGVGGGLYLARYILGVDVGRVFGMSLGGLISLILIIIAGILLISDLGKPKRFARAMVNLRHSAISVGALSHFILVPASALMLGTQLLDFLKPFGPGSPIYQGLMVLTGILAFIVMIYAGFVLAQSPSIPFWNDALVPMQFLIYGPAGALSVIFLVSPLAGHSGNLPMRQLAILQSVLLIACLTATVTHYIRAKNSSGAARESARLLGTKYAAHFIGGLLVVGLMIPLAITSVAATMYNPSLLPALQISGLLALIGNFLMRYTLVKSGCYAPPLEFRL